MTELDFVRAAEAALERSRARLDDLNVYPVPDGDTGTNMLLTVRAVREALEAGESDIVRAALLGARGNSGVILSQIVRCGKDVPQVLNNAVFDVGHHYCRSRCAPVFKRSACWRCHV